MENVVKQTTGAENPHLESNGFGASLDVGTIERDQRASARKEAHRTRSDSACCEGSGGAPGRARGVEVEDGAGALAR